MADNEKKTAEAPKPEKKKSDKPSVFQRFGAWLKTVRAECKKITWASWDSVKQNSFVVIVTSIAFAVALGILDYLFNSAILGLSRLF
ncbi:MAG: preprotein translocase subunit SecE [Clostridia bacterium]|nr:preprotein translocase subunit SecE [Clostridia bacterium]MBQ3955754.1 preprotein translocase subunit SecE [Clostridia bacterium]